MKVLVLGASGATGKLLVRQLLERHINVRALLRDSAELAGDLTTNPLLEVRRGNIAEYGVIEMGSVLQDCDAVISCLGHRTSIKGLFGKPHNLVVGAIKTVCQQLDTTTGKRVKLILMSTTAYQDSRTGEKYGLGDRILLALFKILLPPHRDNVRAADYLAGEVGSGKAHIEWVAVRPDGLIDRDSVSAYDVQDSPVRSPVSNAGTTSRINVAHFMAELLTNERLWAERRFTMPVLYNV